LKNLLKNIINNFDWLWKLFPSKLLLSVVFPVLIIASRRKTVRESFKMLFHIKDFLEKIINERGLNYGSGEHPKHKLIGYHDFFASRIKSGEKVLDIGCGYGAVARTMALQNPKSTIIGIDNDQEKILSAKSKDNPPNLRFIHADAEKSRDIGNSDVVVLSNVLEHISERVNFLRNIQKLTMAKRFLIRVPNYERDWQIALRDHFELNYFSDPDHKIEHKRSEFLREINDADLYLIEIIFIWGEIWAECGLSTK